MRTSIRASLIALAMLPVATLSVTAPASARDGQNAAGIIGGLAAGAIVGGAIANSGRPYEGGYVEDGYRPVYTEACHRERQPIYDSWGNYRGDRIVRVCD